MALAAIRRQQGMLTLDDLVQIAQLSDDQLNGTEMAEGAEAFWGLAEWRLVRNGTLRPHLRFLAEFTPAQRQDAMNPSGLTLARMSLSQQQGFLARTLHQHPDDDRPLGALDELEGAALRVEYTHPGGFQRRAPVDWGKSRWVRDLEPGPRGRRAMMPPVNERTREAALQAARRILPEVDASEIHPTELILWIVYFPGTSNGRLLHVVGPRSDVTPS